MDISLNIAGLKILLKNIKIKKIPSQFLPFVVEKNNEKEDINYKFLDIDMLNQGHMKSILKTYRHEIYKDGNAYIKESWLRKEDGKEEHYYTKFEWGKREIKIYVPFRLLSAEFVEHYLNNLLMFDCVIGWHHRIIMHASIVNYNSEALLFTGPSGIGKSTQSNLWQEYMGADIINGDRAILDVEKDGVVAYGSPYAGSSGIYRNEFCKVRAIIFLSQEPENRIRKLSPAEAYKALFPRFSMVRWDDVVAEEFMSTVAEIISRIPVYHLGCRPDKEAVGLAYQMVFSDDKIEI